MTRRWLPASLLAVSLAAPGHAAGRCDNVETHGRFSVVTLPPQVVSGAFDVIPAATRSQRDVLLAAAGRVLMRSGDGGCTWQQVFSLDTGTPDTGWAKHSASVTFQDLAVSQNSTGPRTVYAVGRDTSAQATAGRPYVTVVSTDGGTRWAAHEPPLGPDVLDHRCAAVNITAGPDPRLAHLTCNTVGLGELGLVVLAQCQTMQFVTTDAGATWRPANLRYSPPRADLTKAPCSEMNWPTADPLAPHVLWHVPVCKNFVNRSSDDGKTASAYATWSATGCEYYLAVGSDGRGRGRVATCGVTGDVWVAQNGRLVRAPLISLRAHQKGTIRGCAVDHATGRVVALYLDGERKQRVYSYDADRKRWQLLGIVPAGKDGTGLWNEDGAAHSWTSPASRYVYARKASNGDRVLRVAL